MEQRFQAGRQRSQHSAVFRASIFAGACLVFGVFWLVLHALTINRALPGELQQLGDSLHPSHPLVALTVRPERLAIPVPTLVPTAPASPQALVAIAFTATPLAVPTMPPAPDRATAERPPRVYTVQPGDTLYSIARRNNMSPQALAALNGLPSSALVKVGQKLKLA